MRRGSVRASSLPRHNHALQPWLRTVTRLRPSKIVIRKPAPPISLVAGIPNRRLRVGRHPMPTLRPHGQRTTITSCAARSPRRNQRSPFFSPTSWEQDINTLTSRPFFSQKRYTQRPSKVQFLHLHATNNSITYIPHSASHKPCYEVSFQNQGISTCSTIRHKRTFHARVARFHIDPQGKSLAVRGDSPRDYPAKPVVL